jgi:hypothetical protein
MKATFDSMSAERYEFTHGRRPRGEGCWAFELRAGDRKRQIFIDATYAEAKKQALERATQEGYCIVSVLT